MKGISADDFAWGNKFTAPVFVGLRNSTVQMYVPEVDARKDGAVHGEILP